MAARAAKMSVCAFEGLAGALRGGGESGLVDSACRRKEREKAVRERVDCLGWASCAAVGVSPALADAGALDNGGWRTLF